MKGIPSNGYYVDPTVTCSSGQYRNGRNCYPCQSPCDTCSSSATNCDSCISGYTLSGHSCERIPTLQAPSSQEDCHDAYYYQGMCITKINAGDEGGPSINIPNVKVTATKTSCSGKFCCWRGSKTVPHFKDKTGSTYSAKNRTACEVEAAKLICENYSTDWSPNWELPSSVDATLISGASVAVRGVYGLQLCSSSDIDGINYCSASDGEKADYQFCKGGNKGEGEINYHKCRIAVIMNAGKTDSSTGSVRCITKSVYK